jgi:4-amino-4-deoxy-L-arabinose transferase-like glycosyltransferase
VVDNKGNNWLVRRQDFVNIAILLTVALGIGIYLVVTTTLIAQDGMSYINYAKGLNIDFFKVLRDSSEYSPRLYTPGYPFLILITHKLVDLFSDGSTVSSWIYSAQAINLLCRILALIPLYFIGKEFVGNKLSFWAIFILIMLPYPGQMGSDVLKDWPHMLFLATGFLLLLWAARHRSWLLFALVGIVSGLGYTIRPMCVQLVVYGVLWLILALFTQKAKTDTSRGKLAACLIFLIVGFAVVAAPYMKIRGEILPRRLQNIINPYLSKSVQTNLQHQEDFMPVNSKCAVGLLIGKGSLKKGLAVLIRRISENLMYYFVPAMFIGMYCYFRKKPKTELLFFIIAFLLANIAIIIARYVCIDPSLSRRYLLPFISFTIFFVTLGLQIIGGMIARALSNSLYHNVASQKQSKLWFFVLLVIGIVICVPKLFRPIRIEKKGYRLAAEWLKENTTKEDVIAVPDIRISFYAERKGVSQYEKGAKYVVKEVTSLEKNIITPMEMSIVWSSYLNKKKKYKVEIYQRM